MTAGITIREFTDQAGYIQASADFVIDVCKEIPPPVYIALAGGSAKSVYESLADQLGLGPYAVEFFQVDERYVPRDHPDSNFKMIAESRLVSAGKKFHAFETHLPIPQTLERYEQELRARTREFDLSILGIGPDGHIASLFPGSSALEEKMRLAAHTTTKQFAIPDRLTLTYPVILESRKILVLLAGKSKRDIITELQKTVSAQPYEKFPANKLREHADVTVHFYNQ